MTIQTTTLDNQQLRLVVVPQQGVNILAFSVFHNDAWLTIMPDVRNGGVDLQESSFIMAPYSNRIENGRFTFGGQEVQLAYGERHAIHGDVRTRPWTVESESDHRIHARFDSRQHQNVNWPWPFSADVEYSLDDLTLISRLRLINQGDSPMPAGFGWHPYYSRWLTQKGEPVQLHFQVRGVYPDAHNNRIPSGPAQPPAPSQDFRSARLLDPNHFLDICCYGYDGDGSIQWPESGVRVRYRCSSECSHLVLYNPAKPYFAVEPVTNANNGVNLLAQGDPTSGIRVLSPGETLAATFETIVELA